MAATIIDGKAIAAKLRTEIATEAAALAARGMRPGLAVVLVGEDPASKVYVSMKEKACAEAGIFSDEYKMHAETTEADLLTLIDRLNNDPKIHGILVQLPLPKHINTEKVLEAISPHKDVDGFHPYNVGRLALRIPLIRPCTPYGIVKMLDALGISPRGKHAVIVGASNIVGRPMALELLMERCTVTICHSKTRDLPGLVRQADILVAGIGKANFVQGDWVKPGTIVIDVGINRNDEGKLCGDVDFASVAPIAGFITPVPGGVGPMTITMLLVNTVEAAERAAAGR